MKLNAFVKWLWQYYQISKHDNWTREQLESYQAAALIRLCDYTYANSSFYQQFHRGLFERPLSDLPVLTKDIMMENFNNLVTDL